MRLLLDTQAVICWGLDSPGLSLRTSNLLAEGGGSVHLSGVSVWEMAIKRSIGKLPLPRPALTMCREMIEHSGFRPLEITFEHLGAVESLPLHHRDPFDRLLIAQAQVENLTIVSGDASFDAYGVDRLW